MHSNANPGNQREQQRLETRQRLQTAAIDLFAELGYDGATTRAIAEKACLKQSLIVYHFGSKEGLWKAAVDEVWARIDARLADFVNSDAVVHTHESLHRSLRNYLQVSAEHPEYLRILLREMGQPGPRLDWLVERHTVRHTSRSLAFLGDAQSQGLIKNIPPIHLAYIIFGAVAVVLAGAPEVERATGQNPLSKQFLDEHARSLATLLFTAERVVKSPE